MKANTDSTNSSGIAALYSEYHRPILAYLMRLVRDYEAAEDLCQETFLKAMRRWDQHDPQLSVSAWLYRIATNTAYDYLRRCRRIRFLPLPTDDQHSNEIPMIETPFDEGGPVQAALAQLPPRYRMPLLWHTCGGHTVQEIAAALGCSNSAVKTRLFRARERFREVYRG